MEDVGLGAARPVQLAHDARGDPRVQRRFSNGGLAHGVGQLVRAYLLEDVGEGASLDRVKALMRVGRGFRYSFTEPYTAALPSVTATLRAGDCKAKALWLCDQLGDENVRFVVGKARISSRISHAWVMWQHEGRWWILDCTNTSIPIPADRVARNEYIPLYSWSKGGTFRHSGTQMFAATVAGKQNSPVAAASQGR